jgi:hypothetical protein
MTDQSEELSDIGERELPFGRRVKLQNVDFHNGLNLLRLTWREGRRFTQIDLDPESAEAFATDVLEWARANSDDTPN